MARFLTSAMEYLKINTGDVKKNANKKQTNQRKTSPYYNL